MKDSDPATCCPAGLRPRQPNGGGVLHRPMSSGGYEEHLRECLKRRTFTQVLH